MIIYFVTYKTMDGKTVTKGCSNEQQQSKEYSLALQMGCKPQKFERSL